MTDDKSKKDQLLEQIQTERRRFEANLAGLDAEAMLAPGAVGAWSVKDVLAHLTDWEQRFLAWYELGRTGGAPEIPAPGLTWGKLDVLNRQIYEQHRDRSLEDVCAWFDASYRQILDAVAAMTEQELFEPGYYPWTGKADLARFVAANTGNHYRWAKQQLRNWIKAGPGQMKAGT
jgi:uncharacterized protein (TIGR03083 family)